MVCLYGVAKNKSFSAKVTVSCCLLHLLSFLAVLSAVKKVLLSCTLWGVHLGGLAPCAV